MTINLCDAGCGNVALVGTNQCLQHLDAGARVPVPPLLPLRDVDGLLERMGAELDAQDFTAAADSVRPEIADAIEAAADEHARERQPLGMDPLAQLVRQFDAAGGIDASTVPPPLRARIPLDDLVEMKQKVDAAYGPIPIEAKRPVPDMLRALVIAEATAERRCSIVDRIWRALRRWSR